MRRFIGYVATFLGCASLTVPLILAWLYALGALPGAEKWAYVAVGHVPAGFILLVAGGAQLAEAEYQERDA